MVREIESLEVEFCILAFCRGNGAALPETWCVGRLGRCQQRSGRQDWRPMRPRGSWIDLIQYPICRYVLFANGRICLVDSAPRMLARWQTLDTERGERKNARTCSATA